MQLKCDVEKHGAVESELMRIHTAMTKTSQKVKNGARRLKRTEVTQVQGKFRIQ